MTTTRFPVFRPYFSARFLEDLCGAVVLAYRFHLVSILVSLRFLFLVYREETGNEQRYYNRITSGRQGGGFRLL